MRTGAVFPGGSRELGGNATLIADAFVEVGQSAHEQQIHTAVRPTLVAGTRIDFLP
jgi:hypothetical protein